MDGRWGVTLNVSFSTEKHLNDQEKRHQQCRTRLLL